MGKDKKTIRDLGSENTANIAALKTANVSSFDLVELNAKLDAAYKTVYDAQETSKKNPNQLAGGMEWQKAVATYDQTVAQVRDEMTKASAGTEGKYKNRKYLDEQMKLKADQPGKSQVTMPINLQPVVPAKNTSELK